MRKFIVSDLHGNGNVYNSIMGYLENINKEEDVTLYINGDLIDRGPDSSDMLLDVIDRINKGPFKIEYLGGSHELLMHMFFIDRKNLIDKYYNNWFFNGGMSTYYDLEDNTKDDEELLKVADFVSNLKIYHKFEEKINNKNIVLVHASSNINIKDECDLRIKDNNKEVELGVFSREHLDYFPCKCCIGNPKYFSIVGHTPNLDKNGFVYNSEENYLNIDGGSSMYVSGVFNWDHVPLVEVNDEYLRIIIFNNNNEIIKGFFMDKDRFYPFSFIELQCDRKYLNKSLKVKKLIKNEDGVVYYE